MNESTQIRISAIFPIGQAAGSGAAIEVRTELGKQTDFNISLPIRVARERGDSPKPRDEQKWIGFVPIPPSIGDRGASLLLHYSYNR